MIKARWDSKKERKFPSNNTQNILFFEENNITPYLEFKIRCHQKGLMRNSCCFFHKMRGNIVRVELTVDGSKNEKRYYCNIDNHKIWDIKENLALTPSAGCAHLASTYE